MHTLLGQPKPSQLHLPSGKPCGGFLVPHMERDLQERMQEDPGCWREERLWDARHPIPWEASHAEGLSQNPPQPKSSILGKAGLTQVLQSYQDAVPGNLVSCVAKRANIIFARDNNGRKTCSAWQQTVVIAASFRQPPIRLIFILFYYLQ